VHREAGTPRNPNIRAVHRTCDRAGDTVPHRGHATPVVVATLGRAPDVLPFAAEVSSGRAMGPRLASVGTGGTLRGETPSLPAAGSALAVLGASASCRARCRASYRRLKASFPCRIVPTAHRYSRSTTRSQRLLPPAAADCFNRPEKDHDAQCWKSHDRCFPFQATASPSHLQLGRCLSCKTCTQ